MPPDETDDLRSALEASYDSSVAENTDETSPPPPPPAPTPAPSPADQTAPAPAPESASPPPAPEAKDLAEAKAAIEADRPIPGRLKAKWGEKWQTIDKELRAEFHAYESHIGGLASKYGKAAKNWEETEKVFAPYAQLIAEEGGNFHSAVGNLFETARILRQGLPEQKLALVQQICQIYGIPPQAVAGRRASAADAGAGETGAGAPAPSSATQDYPTASPQILQRLAYLERELLTRDAGAEYTTQQKVASDIEAFIADPANIYLQEPGYLDTMAGLISAGKAADLQAAYKAAAWLHERPRELEIARLTQERTRSRAEAAAKAKQVGVSVNGASPGDVRVNPQEMDLRSTIAAAMDGEL